MRITQQGLLLESKDDLGYIEDSFDGERVNIPLPILEMIEYFEKTNKVIHGSEGVE